MKAVASMEEICSSETSVLLTRATRRHIPDEKVLHCYCRENAPSLSFFNPT
jgi:hypothetical protein